MSRIERQPDSPKSLDMPNPTSECLNTPFDIAGVVIEKWQRLVDLMAELIGVPAGLIMRLVGTEIQVLVSSDTEGNPYPPGSSTTMAGSGLYCETVISSGSELLIPNALASDRWKDNPDTKFNMISYLGFPIRWPDQSPFGTICVLDCKENAYSEKYIRLVAEFRDLAECHLQLIHSEFVAKRDHQTVAQMVVDLGHQKEIAEEANLAKSRFLAAASHDLRQPVHALSLFIGALRSVPMDAKGQGLVDQIEASADAMDRLFAALLDISKLDAGIVEVLRKPFAIDAVLIRVYDDFAGEAAAKGLKLSYVRCRAIVDSDPILVERIARNLISNAVRYTDAGRIVVGCRRRGSSVAMQVWDTGRGISSGQQEQVFQEYYQVDNPERDREKGLGLGLAIVRRVADLLECDLYLRSEIGQGSCFEISLPQASEAAMPLSEPVDKICITSTTGHVVVIDDEKAIRAGMSALLTNWGYEVLAVSSADEAIQFLASYTRKPDLLICDLRLRDGENGIEAIEKLRTEYNESIPAMLITGDTAARRLHEAQTSELLVLHKPVPNGKLRATIARLVTARPIQQESDTEV